MDIFWTGAVMFGVGLVPWTVANLMNMVQNPGGFNRQMLSHFSLKGGDSQAADRDMNRSLFSYPRTRLPAIAGIALCGTGMALMCTYVWFLQPK